MIYMWNVGVLIKDYYLCSKSFYVLYNFLWIIVVGYDWFLKWWYVIEFFDLIFYLEFVVF